MHARAHRDTLVRRLSAERVHERASVLLVHPFSLRVGRSFSLTNRVLPPSFWLQMLTEESKASFFEPLKSKELHEKWMDSYKGWAKENVDEGRDDALARGARISERLAESVRRYIFVDYLFHSKQVF